MRPKRTAGTMGTRSALTRNVIHQDFFFFFFCCCPTLGTFWNRHVRATCCPPSAFVTAMSNRFLARLATSFWKLAPSSSWLAAAFDQVGPFCPLFSLLYITLANSITALFDSIKKKHIILRLLLYFTFDEAPMSMPLDNVFWSAISIAYWHKREKKW